MKDTDFAFAVAKIRVLETRLLTAAEAERMMDAQLESETERILSEKGYDTSLDAEAMLEKSQQELIAFITEITPQSGLLDFVLLKNDFHNLKNALKDLVTAAENTAGYGPGGLYPPQAVIRPVMEKDFSALPALLAPSAAAGYELLTAVYDGQAADCWLDRESLVQSLAAAEKSGSPLAVRIAKLQCTMANIRIAYRAITTGKDAKFLSAALCPGSDLSVRELTAAAKSEESLFAFLSERGYTSIADAIRVSPSAFEKQCDDRILDMAGEARYKSFGPDPLIAYYFARQAEMKTIRMILTCRRLGVPREEIRQRVRKLYV